MDTPRPAPAPLADRLFDVDWLRLIAIGLVFASHTGRLFDTMEPWHFKNPIRSDTFTIPMGIGSQFVMPLFFVLSGISTRFALGSRPWREFAWKRVLRLGVPVVTLGWFVFNPLQIYIEASTDQQYNCPPFSGTFWQFLPRAFSGRYGVDGYFCWSGVHLWYLAWLLLFTLASLPLFVCLRSERGKRVLSALVGVLCRPGMIFLPGLLLVLTEQFFPRSVPYLSNNEGGWIMASHWLLLILGWVIGSDLRLREAMRRQRWVALALADLTLVPLATWAFTLGDGWNGDPVLLFHWAWRTMNGWFWVVAILGLGAEYLNRPHKALALLGPAVLPFYILHQPLIVVLGYLLAGWALPVLPKYLLIGSLVLVLALGFYFLAIRRSRLLRFLFGLPAASGTS